MFTNNTQGDFSNLGSKVSPGCVLKYWSDNNTIHRPVTVKRIDGIYVIIYLTYMLLIAGYYEPCKKSVRHYMFDN